MKGDLSRHLSIFALLILTACGSSSRPSKAGSSSNSSSVQLTVQLSGEGSGTVISSPEGIDCPATCSAEFVQGTSVALTVSPAAGSAFSSWSGTCAGAANSCTITAAENASVTAAFRVANINALQHIIFMLQENRSFDHYFGHLPEYWAENGYAPEPFDGYPADASNPALGNGATVTPFHLETMCIEHPAPDWDESHRDRNYQDPTADTVLMDGFVRDAARLAIGEGLHDTSGSRVMGYYNDLDLPYYYFMASNFATSDRWFSPVMAESQLNRMFLMAATSAGHVFETNHRLPNKTIFQLLDEHNISWKIYVSDYVNNDPARPETNFSSFTYDTPPHTANVVPVSQYLADVANGTLPQVAMIEAGYSSGRDEHPTDSASIRSGNVQLGSAYVASLINPLMQSSSWSSSVFILTYDEFGGFYDHVPPQPAVNPDGVPPVDLPSGDVCSGDTSPICNFQFTGYRVPLIVISPFSKKHYVSHTVADYTAILKLIETRFNLPNLTARDAAQMDMTEFFDFADAPWTTPPVPPSQHTSGPCYLDHLP